MGAESGDGGWGGTIDTLTGGTIAVTNPSEGRWTESVAWRLEPDLRLGRLEGDGPGVFGEIFAFAVRPDGGLYVLDGLAQELRLFDSEGEYLHTIARKGAGPGEIEYGAGLTFDGQGGLWVWDTRNRRYSRFHPDGTFDTSYRRELRGVAYPWLGRVIDDRMIDIGYDRIGDGPNTIGAQNFHYFIRYARDFSSHDTLPPLTSTLDLVGQRVLRPFTGRLRYYLSQHGAIWWIHTSEYRLYRRNLTGDTLIVATLPYTPPPVTAAERDSAIQANEVIRQRIPSWPAVNAEDVLDHHPVAERLIVDDRGNVIVFLVQPETAGSVFDVFDSAGVYQGRVQAPVRFDLRPPPQIRDDYMVGVVQDEFDVEYLVRLRLRR